MTTIRQDDLIQSIADAFQFISYYHPKDYIQSLAKAYELEESPAAKDAMAQILLNSRMCAMDQRPICQDTGIAVVFMDIGMDIQWDGATMSVEDMVNEGLEEWSELTYNFSLLSLIFLYKDPNFHSSQILKEN